MPRLPELLEKSRARAQELGRPVLASYSELVVPMDPLAAIADVQPQMYWAAADRSVSMLGIGSAMSIGGNGPTRFAESAAAARSVLDEAVVEPSLYRPVLMGGFAFDSDGPRTPAWDGFEPAGLVVPRLLLRRRGDDCIVTLNTVVSAVTHVENTARELRELQRAATSGEVSSKPAFVAQTPAAAPAVTPRWRELVQRAVEAIRAGEFVKVVLAREEQVGPLPDLDVPAVLRHLRDANPGTFIYAVWRGDAVFLGASPELLVRLNGRDVTTSVLAGSTRRGENAAEDRTLGHALAANAKDREEHAIVRRDLETSLARVCDNIRLDARPDLVTLPHVQHLHTGVRAQLRDGRTVFDVLERLHPTSAVGGSPREPALRFLRAHEGVDRGWYAAPVGWTDCTNAEFTVALRCALVGGESVRVYAGCGIVAQSDPDAEWEESQLKLRPALEALSAGVAEAQAAP